jgi:anaerobic selenocysteine-containing dehydrogenase
MRYYRERRVLYPHLRVGDGFERISWEEALSMISDRLKYVIENYNRKPRPLGRGWIDKAYKVCIL